MSDKPDHRDTSYPTEKPSRPVHGIREIAQAAEKASMQSGPRLHRKTVENPDMCKFEYNHLRLHFQSLKEYIDSEDKDIRGDGNIVLFDDAIRDSVETLYDSNRSNPDTESLKAIQTLKRAAYEYRNVVETAGKLGEIFDTLNQHWTAQQSDASSSHDTGKAPEVPQYLELATNRFNNQALTGRDGVFPNINLDDTEKQAHNNVRHHYAQAFLEQATQIYGNILRRYDPSQIYCKCYGVTQLVAVRHTNNDTIFVGPSQNALITRFGVNINASVYQPIGMEVVSERLQNNGSVQWALPDISKPLYKSNEEYRGKYDRQSRTGPVGLYITDNHAQIAQQYGGNSSVMGSLYLNSSNIETTGPWKLPEGAVLEQPQTRSSRSQKFGQVSKLTDW